VTDLSIVIPAYNEADRLGPTLDDLLPLLTTVEGTTEVIVVDDGSEDATIAVAERHLAAFPAGSVISSTPNRGKGLAVRIGMTAATGDRRLFMDADGSTALDEIGRFLRHAAATGDQVVIGSIGRRDEHRVIPQSRFRTIAGRAANLLIQAVVLPGIKDTQRGFKLFDGETADEIFGRCTIDGWLFDVEALAIARRRGYRIAELPVAWQHKEDSRVKASSYLRVLWDLLRIRWRLWRGHYDA
jgi:dolichyl-phosphate beta-glucosyltransferase